MRKKIKQLLLCCLLISGALLAGAQQYGDIINDVTKIKEAVADSSGIAFTMRFLYSRESKPAKFLDSLQGVYKIKGRKLYSSISGTETIQNDSACITVYSVDKTIIAGNPSTERKDNLFINNWDSAFVAYNVDTALITTNGNAKTMKFRFAKTSSLYICTMVYDKNTYLPQRFSYVMRNSKIPETGRPERDGTVITIQFKNYSRSALSDDLFSTDKYISVQNGKAVLKPAWQAYKLFQSTPQIGR